jgi:hypothetical protein
MKPFRELSVLAVWLCTACAVAARPGQTRPQPEAGTIAAALAHFSARNEGVLRVDPRPLRGDASLTGVHNRDFARDGTAVARARQRFLREHGIAETDAAADMRCVFSRGVPPTESDLHLEPDSIRVQRATCLRDPVHTTFAFTRAELLGGDQAIRFGAGAVRIRAYRLTTWSFELWDLYLAPNSGAWNVVDSRRLVGVAS